MTRERVFKSRRRIGGFLGVLIALSLLFAVPAASAPPPGGDGLSGTWRVDRTCLAGCTGSTILTEVVHPYRDAVFMATGTAIMMLDRIAQRKVLVHAALSSSLLTIRIPGQLMRGRGVGQDGSVFRVTWRCTARAGASTSVAHRRGLRPQMTAGARVIC